MAKSGVRERQREHSFVALPINGRQQECCDALLTGAHQGLLAVGVKLLGVEVGVGIN